MSRRLDNQVRALLSVLVVGTYLIAHIGGAAWAFSEERVELALALLDPVAVAATVVFVYYFPNSR